ncbi:hypothetical protein HU200_016114 [Digitaria exilis]|uniref:Dirigent protein n=1 Tax=Digitaria exilis TaxID=1010633 RepID=A0A835KKD7_9POAL|nr:hypothetical protein HU200_016114 [Digitaria exilis]
MNQRGEDQTSIASSPTLPHGFGSAVANDWIIREGPAANTNIVARVRGITVSSGKTDENWLFCHSILFTDTRFKGSSLKVHGDFVGGKDGEWAIVGGTGEFAYARGVITAKLIENWHPANGRLWELDIRAFCLCVPEVMPQTNMGPWGGDGGLAFDILESPRSLQTVTIRCGDVVNSIAFSYVDQGGQKKTAGPWGGDGNGDALTATIKLAPSETIQQIVGTTGTAGEDTVVTSLSLVSNIRTYGPFGKATGTPFNSQVPSNKIIVGFHARAGASVNAIGVYVLTKVAPRM